MQKRGRIEFLILMFRKENGVTQWKDVKKLGYSDSTYRSACKELVDLGMVEELKTRQPLQRRYRLTDFGCLIASLIDEKVKDLDLLISHIIE